LTKEKIPQNEEEIKPGSKLRMKVPYFQTPNSIFDNENELTEHELIVYIYLCRCGNQGATAFPSLPTIGRKTKTSRATAARAISGLIKHGFIIKENRIGTSNTYEIIDNAGVVSDRDGVVSDRDGVVVSDRDPRKNYSFNKNYEERDTLSNLTGKEKNQIVEKVIQCYTDLFTKANGISPVITKANRQQVAALVDKHSADLLLAAVDLHVNAPDTWTKERGCPLATLEHNLPVYIQKLNSRAAEEEAERKRKEHDRQQQETWKAQEEEAEKRRAEWEALPEEEKQRQREEQKRVIEKMKQAKQ
jgi:hypothetical protein